MSTHRLRILHISDLHERVELSAGSEERRHKTANDRAARERVLGESLDAAIRQAKAERGFDLICFTGDAADWGDAAEYEATGKLLQRVMAVTGVDSSRLFVVPGNHDIQRNQAKAAWKGIRRHIGERADAVGRWMAGEPMPAGMTRSWRDTILSRQKAYRNWVGDDLRRPECLPSDAGHPRLGYRATFELAPSVPVHIIGLDTAWLCGNDSDAGQIHLTPLQIDRLATDHQGRRLTGFRLALAHHALGELADVDPCTKRLGGYADLLLHGHVHKGRDDGWLDQQRGSRAVAVGCLFEGDYRDNWTNAFHVVDVTLDDAGAPLRFVVTPWLWDSDGDTWVRRDDRALSWSTTLGQQAEPPPLVTVEPKRGFIGRDEQLTALANALLPGNSGQRPVVVCNVQGMAGVGKSWLVEQFFATHAEAFGRQFMPLVLAPDERPTAQDLLGRLADSLKVPADQLLPVLRASQPLVHLENVDNADLAKVAAELAKLLAGVPLVITGRFAGFSGGGWQVVPIRSFELGDAMQQLREELADSGAYLTDDDQKRVVGALGGLPLALHLAAGYLRAGHTAESFLGLLAESELDLAPFAPDDDAYSHHADLALRATFDLSLRAFEQSGQSVEALCALGMAPRAGFGDSLAAAVCGLDEDHTVRLLVAARALSLVEMIAATGGAARRWRLHPLVAEHLRGGLTDEAATAAFARLCDWFIERLPWSGDAHQGKRWRELEAEQTGLVEWLDALPDDVAGPVAVAGYEYARTHGPLHVWLAAAERGLEADLNDGQRSRLHWRRANLAQQAGEHELALAEVEAMGDLARRVGDDRDAALAAGLRADILTQRGETDEALRIRREEELPVFERLGEVRERAVTLGKIADILARRGDTDEALRILREEELPVHERLGDVRSRAVTMGKVAGILTQRGETDEALRIRREDQLPVFEWLGDVRERAVTMGRIADILTQRGETDEELRIRREEELPVYERLGDVHSQAVTMSRIADILTQRGETHEALRIMREELVPVFGRLGDVHSRAATLGNIADILTQLGETDEALRILREEQLPVFERLGDVRSLLVGRTNLAITLLRRGHQEDRAEAVALLRLALDSARQLRIPEAGAIEGILRQIGEKP